MQVCYANVKLILGKSIRKILTIKKNEDELRLKKQPHIEVAFLIGMLLNY